MLYIKPKSESGMAMFVVMMVSFLSAVLVTSYMGFVIQEFRHSIWQKEKAQSLYLAEAGIQKGLYYLNGADDPDNPWAQYIDFDAEVLLVDEDQVPEYTGTDIDDSTDSYEESYTISLHDSFVDEDGAIVTLPPKYFLIKSTGTIKRTIPIKHSVSAIVSMIEGVPAPGALVIYDDADPENELEQFQSSQWVISGIDIDGDGTTGVAGITIANTGDNIKEAGGQLDLPGLPSRIDQVSGIDADGNVVSGGDAIFENEDLPNDLEALVAYFMPMSPDDISGIGTIPSEYLGAPDDFQLLYANLSQGSVTLPGNRTGYGVLILENEGIFEMKGNAEWYGLILCYGGATIAMRGGGKSPAHVYGALMLDDGTVTTNGTADIRYSSWAMHQIENQMIVYQVFAWCGGWGKHLGRFDDSRYISVASVW